MATQTMNFNGLKCPQPVLKLAVAARTVPAGTVVEVLADCAEFPNDVKKWCEKQGKTLMGVTNLGAGKFKAEIRF